MKPQYVYVANDHMIAEMILVGEKKGLYYLVEWDSWSNSVETQVFNKNEVFATAEEAVAEFKRHIDLEKSK